MNERNETEPSDVLRDPAYVFSCSAYVDGVDHSGGRVPDRFWLRYDLVRPSGQTTTLVYDREPDNAGEPPELAWRLPDGGRTHRRSEAVCHGRERGAS